MDVVTLKELKRLVEHMETIGANKLHVDIDWESRRIDFDELDEKCNYLQTFCTWWR